MIPEKMLDILKHEGVVAIVTQGESGAHLVNTWNSYLKVTEDERLIFPAGGMYITEANINQNDKVLMTIGSREVEGLHSPGAGFLLNGKAAFIKHGNEFDEIKQRFPWARAAVEIKLEFITQTL